MQCEMGDDEDDLPPPRLPPLPSRYGETSAPPLADVSGQVGKVREAEKEKQFEFRTTWRKFRLPSSSLPIFDYEDEEEESRWIKTSTIHALRPCRERGGRIRWRLRAQGR